MGNTAVKHKTQSKLTSCLKAGGGIYVMKFMVTVYTFKITLNNSKESFEDNGEESDFLLKLPVNEQNPNAHINTCLT